MRLTPRTVRIGIVAALVGPVALMLLANILRAQIPQPKFQPPPQPKFQPPPQPKSQPPPQPNIPNVPVIVNEWKCGKCNRVIGNGNFPPGKCQFCGVKILNGVDTGAPAPPGPPVVNPNPTPPVVNSPPGQPNVAPTTTKTEDTGSSGDGTTTWIVVGIIILVVLVGAGLAIFLIVGQGTKPKRSKRRSRRYRDDDDDDDDEFSIDRRAKSSRRR